MLTRLLLGGKVTKEAEILQEAFSLIFLPCKTFTGQQYSRFNCYLCQVIFCLFDDCTRRSVEVVTQTSVLNTILSHSEIL